MFYYFKYKDNRCHTLYILMSTKDIYLGNTLIYIFCNYIKFNRFFLPFSFIIFLFYMFFIILLKMLSLTNKKSPCHKQNNGMEILSLLKSIFYCLFSLLLYTYMLLYTMFYKFYIHYSHYKQEFGLYHL